MASKVSNTSECSSNGYKTILQLKTTFENMFTNIWVPEYTLSDGDNNLQAWITLSRMSEEKQYGGHVPIHRASMEPDYSEEEEDEPRINPVGGLYTREEIEKFGEDMTRKKCHILDCVLDTFPEHLKAKAKSMCDILKCKDRFFILPSHEILFRWRGWPRK